MRLSVLVFVVGLFLWACGGSTAGKDAGLMVDVAVGVDLLDGAHLDVPDAGTDAGKDAVFLDTRDTVDGGVDTGKDLADLVGQDTTDTIDALADTVPTCNPTCTPYQLCNLETLLCEANPLCETEFCAGEDAGMDKVEGLELFYVDRFEWPNVQWAFPEGGVADLGTATQKCLSVGKRLCTELELAIACSPEGQAYPYGVDYDLAACNTELPYTVDPSGTNLGCHSPESSAFDLAGNLAEWTATGKLFGGTVKDGVDATCARLAAPGDYADATLFGTRCCLSPNDDLDGDGVQASLDCDDTNDEVKPGVEEVCNGLDDDCDGLTDNTEDADKDGFNSCVDCNDKAGSIYPGADDELGDEVDADCDGQDGEDRDGDGYFSKARGGDDCDDTNPLTYPGAAELCDGQDNDCDDNNDEDLGASVCNDDNACTTDSCDGEAKACKHEALACEDDNQCTLNDCSPATGCVNTKRSGDCDDQDPCTLSDSCINGECVGMTNGCDDLNPCTSDVCNLESGECEHQPVDGDCEDADPCSTGDFCQDGQCKAGVGKLDCDDHNDCTTDDCQKGLGCKNTARQGFCNDGDSCTADDYCLDGVCTGGTNSCGCSTDDECEPLNDADWCNGYLYCNKGKTPAVCELNLKSIKTCNTAGDSTCQAEVCDPGDGVCKFKARNEGQVCAATCTVNPTCQAGQCKGQSCVAAGMACASGTCIANACAAGLKVCDGDFAYLTCNGSGNGWTGPTSCGDGKYCDGGDCKAQVCTPSAAACVGKLAGTCNSSGSGLVAGYTNCEAIPATPFCQGGACTACSPNCTGKVCGDDGCGGSCGECTTFCINEKGRCCVPDCKERNCGVDGCGGNCGTCEGARVCSASGRCIFDIETLGNKWLSIPGGTFKMGCSDGDENCMSDERPTRMVTTTAFEMLETEVTEAQYLSVVGDNPSCKTCGSSGPSMPVDSVDWEQAKSFCTMVGGRLPSEAEWEYAARGGTSTRFYCGNDLACRSSVAWTGGPGKHAVKGKLPNNFGLYDMLGNVWEWTADWHGTFSSAAQTDPTGPVKGTVHAKRGGGFADGQVCGYLCPHVMSRVSARQGPPPPSDYSWGYYFGGPSALGFRCARQNCSSGLPACGKKECGDDGCGHSCGICNDSSQCNLGRCVPNWAGVDSGQYHVCASGEDGSVWCWGSNSSSEAGFQNTDYYIHIPRRLDYPTGVMMLAAGDQHTCALKADGAVWCWGRNGSGQLGNGETNSSPDPQAVRVLGLPSVRTIFSGAYHVCSVDYEGSVWCWGRNSEGQLGDGFKTDRSTPAKVSGLPKIVSMALGMYHSCALAESGAIWCWGFNTQGQLGTGGTTDLAGPQEVNGISNATDLAAGILSSCAVLADGAVACWGYNGTGELGLGAKDNLPHPVPVKVSNLPSITRVWSSFYHVCALDVANNIWCWGLNYSGGLGDGSIIDRALPVKVQSIGAVEELSLSMGSTCTRKNDGSIWCWGSGDYGELGDGKGTSSLIPVKVQ